MRRPALRNTPGGPQLELRCSGCGYGVVVRLAPASCPMCRGSAWELPPRRRAVAPRQI